MKRWKLSSVFIVGLASALLIGAILGIAFDILNSETMSVLLAFGTGTILTAAVDILSRSIRSWRRSTGSASRLSSLSYDELQRVIAKVETENDGWRGQDVHDTASLRLISDIRTIEKEAIDLLQQAGSIPPRRGFLALRSSLVDLGFWTDEDVRRFDEALRVRNALVHGDIGEEVSKSKVLSATKTTSGLLTKLRSINTDAR